MNMYKNIPAYAFIPAASEHPAKEAAAAAEKADGASAAEAVTRLENAVNFGEMPLDSLPLAISYVPMQQFNETYDGLTALQRGTIFPELDLPFCGRGVK